MIRVLVLDDDADFRALAVVALTAWGLDVIEADSGAAADAALAASGPVRLWIVDGALPDTTGVRWIEQHRRTDRVTPAIFVSAVWRDLATFEKLTRELDVAWVIYKPVDVVELVTRAVAALHLTPSPERDALVTARIAALRERFAASLPVRLHVLERALQHARESGADIEAARDQSHKLRGTAGSYGFPGVGIAMGCIEDLLLLIASGAPRPGYLWEQVEAALRDAFHATRTPPLPTDAPVVLPSERTLLVVDDDEEFGRLAREVARKIGVDVTTVMSRAAALQVARDGALAGAVLSVRIEGAPSFSLVEELRATPKNAALPVAFVAAEHGMDLRLAAIEVGAARFLEKPIAESRLSALFHQLVDTEPPEANRVLIVDDDEAASAAAARVLEESGAVVQVLPSPDKLFESLEEGRPDVLLVDVGLPRVTGVDICRALRMSDRWELLPILLLTDRGDDAARLRAWRAGASDVVERPVIPEELRARVGVHLERARLLRERSDRDPLTGLLLRRAFAEAAQRALSRCARDGASMALVLIDIDDFKGVNDRHGHIAGDAVLAGLGNVLSRRFRVEDLRGRWGGDELILAFPGQDADFAWSATSNLLRDVSARTFDDNGRPGFHVTFTAGVAAFPEDGNSLASLLRAADEALYKGKEAGRNQVRRLREDVRVEDHGRPMPEPKKQ